MPATWDTTIDDLQRDVFSRLGNEPFFDDIVILEQRTGVLQSTIDEALSVLKPETGKKIGAVVIVRMIEVDSGGGTGPAPDRSALVQVEISTLPLFNDGADGTQKQASRIAANVLDSLHLYFSGLTGITLHDTARPIVPLEDAEPGEVAYLVSLTGTFSAGRRNKVGTPNASVAESLLTLTSVTDGAVIYYTTDGSYPGPNNEAATLYAEPLALTEGMTLRAVAYRTGWIPSNSAYWETGLVVLTDGEGNQLEDGEGNVLSSGEVDLNTTS